MNYLTFFSAAASKANDHDLTFGEKMSEGVSTFLLGMGTTFIVLITLWLLLELIGYLFKRSAEKKKPAEAAPAPQPAALPAVSQGVDGATVAAITAAVTQVMGAPGAQSGFVIRSIRRSGKRN